MNWDAVGAIATALGTIAASFAAWFAFGALDTSAKSFDQIARSQDFSTLRQFTLDLREAEERLVNATLVAYEELDVEPCGAKVGADEESAGLSRRHKDAVHDALVDYLNLLESMAAGVNEGLLFGVTARFTSERVINDMVIFESRPELKRIIEEARVALRTFVEIEKLKRRSRQNLKLARDTKSLSN